MTLSSFHLNLRLSLTIYRHLLQARLAHLIGTDPLAPDGPGTKALMAWVISGEVAVFDQTASGMSALEMDDFKLCCDVSSPWFEREILVGGTWHIVAWDLGSDLVS